MAQTASHILVQTLYDWGVRVVFGLPGDGINGIIEAFRIPEPVHHTPPLDSCVAYISGPRIFSCTELVQIIFPAEVEI